MTKQERLHLIKRAVTRDDVKQFACYLDTSNEEEGIVRTHDTGKAVYIMGMDPMWSERLFNFLDMCSWQGDRYRERKENPLEYIRIHGRVLEETDEYIKLKFDEDVVWMVI